jgi:hypothetical protein
MSAINRERLGLAALNSFLGICAAGAFIGARTHARTLASTTFSRERKAPKTDAKRNKIFFMLTSVTVYRAHRISPATN